MEALGDLAKRIGKAYQPRDVIFRQGDTGDTMFIIASGRVEIFRGEGEGAAELASMGPGDFFGEMALVDQEPRSATVVAAEPTLLVPITREFVLRHSRKDTRFLFSLVASLCRRLEETNRMIQEKFASRPEPVIALVSRTEYIEPRSVTFLKSVSSAADKRNFLKYDSGAEIFAQGTPGSVMYIILDGKVQIVREGLGKRFILVELGRGSFFGELALITGEPRTAAARAIEPATLLSVDQKFFLDRIQTDPEVALHVVQILILRLRRSLRAVG